MLEDRYNILANKLEIVIITYNRSSLLKITLEQLINCPFSKCKITVLDNCSTDDTVKLASQMASHFPYYNIVKNKINIGGNANIIRAVEISESAYTWVLCDDDKYDFSDCEDVVDAIIEEKYNLIHMGAHEEFWNFGSIANTPKELVAAGYPYFKYCSFLPCNLFRTDLFYKSIIQAYSNIYNWYPHIPFLIEIYQRNEKIYIAKKRIVTAMIGNQEYSRILLFTNWFNTSIYLNKKKEKLIFNLNQDIIVKNRAKPSLNKIIFSYGLNFCYKINRLLCIRLLKVTNAFQTFILLISILLSPLWYLKSYVTRRR